MRLFLASYATVDFYDEIRRDMKPFFDAKWVEPKNLHLTWFFLGEHPSPAPIVERLRPLTMIPKLPLSIQGFGTFGNPHPKLFYLKTASKAVQPLHEQIASLLGEEAQHPFRAHVTLARIKHLHSPGFRHIQKAWMSEPLGIIEAPIYLIESRPTPNGPIYLPIEEF
ncbi:RNA 2',3'-cyclic phosphodiesterase [Hydrogenimonas sp.]